MAINDIFYYIRKGASPHGPWYATSPTWVAYKWDATRFRSRESAEAELERRKSLSSQFYGEVVE